MSLTAFLGIFFLLLALAVIVWGGDGLMKLLPGDAKIKQAAKIIVIVILALWFLSLAASILGVAIPWSGQVRHR
jgi:cell division protein FtsX